MNISNKIVINLDSVDYISSAGLRIFLMAGKKLKTLDGSFVLANMNEHINIIIKDMKNMKEKIEELEYKVTFRYIDMRNENVKRVSRVLLIAWVGLAITFAVKFWPNNVKFVF